MGVFGYLTKEEGCAGKPGDGVSSSDLRHTSAPLLHLIRRIRKHICSPCIGRDQGASDYREWDHVILNRVGIVARGPEGTGPDSVLFRSEFTEEGLGMRME
jgi:hypothetical protein